MRGMLVSETAPPDVGLSGEFVERRSFTSTYSDTSDLLLTRLGITLVRRVENGGSVWELKLPQAARPLELQVAGGPAGPPGELRRLLDGVLGGRELSPVATLRTRRTASSSVVLDAVDVMDSRRVSETFAEFELLDGKRVSKELRRALESSGAYDADAATRLLRVLRVAPQQVKAGPVSVAVRIQRLMRAHSDALLAADPGTRLDRDPEQLHRFRVAARRLRALLRAARPLLDREWANWLRSELGWLGRSAGPLRDLDVLLAHLRAELRALGPNDRSGARRLLKALEAQRRVARRSLLRTLESARYRELLAGLEEPARFAPSARSTLDEIAAREFDQLRSAISQLGGEPADDELHRARIKVKRARYAAEFASDGNGRRTRKFVRRTKALQDVLGEHQDSIVAETRIREVDLEGDPAAAFAAGRLVERQVARREAARAEFPTAWEKLERSGKRAWA